MVAALLLAGCTDDPPPADVDVTALPSLPAPDPTSFSAGTCRDTAPDVLTIGRQVPALGDGPDVDPQVRAELRAAQERLRDRTPEAGGDADAVEALRELSQAVGVVRIRADGAAYEPEFGEQLEAAYLRVLDVCAS